MATQDRNSTDTAMPTVLADAALPPPSPPPSSSAFTFVPLSSSYRGVGCGDGSGLVGTGEGAGLGLDGTGVTVGYELMVGGEVGRAVVGCAVGGVPSHSQSASATPMRLPCDGPFDPSIHRINARKKA